MTSVVKHGFRNSYLCLRMTMFKGNSFFFKWRSVELAKIWPIFTRFCFVILGLIVELERNASSSNKLIDDMKKKHKITDREDKNQKLIAKLEKSNQNLERQNQILENELEEMNQG